MWKSCDFTIKAIEAFLNLLLLNASWEADHREEETIQIEVLKHALNGMSIDAEGDTRHAQIQTAAHHVLRCKDVLTGWGHLTCNTTYREIRDVNAKQNRRNNLIGYWSGMRLNTFISLNTLHLSTGLAHQNHTSKDHLPHRCLPIPLHLQDKDCSPLSKPSPHEDDMPAGSGTNPRGLLLPRSTTSYTALNLHMFPEKYLVSYWNMVKDKNVKLVKCQC